MFYAQSTITVISGQCEGRQCEVLKMQKERCLLQVHTTQNETAVMPSCFTGTYNTKRKCSDVIVFYRYIQNEKAVASPAVTGSYTKMKTVTSPSYNGIYNTKRNGSDVTSCLNTTQNKKCSDVTKRKTMTSPSVKDTYNTKPKLRNTSIYNL